MIVWFRGGESKVLTILLRGKKKKEAQKQAWVTPRSSKMYRRERKGIGVGKKPRPPPGEEESTKSRIQKLCKKKKWSKMNHPRLLPRKGKLKGQGKKEKLGIRKDDTTGKIYRGGGGWGVRGSKKTRPT